MSAQYKCPDCKGVVNSNGFVVLHIEDQHENSGILMLKDSLGDYEAHFSPNLKVKNGDKSSFSCPCCGGSLHHKQNHDLATLQRTDEHGVDSTVVFSAIYGQQSSFEIKEEKVESYGKNMLKFTDPQWYLKV